MLAIKEQEDSCLAKEVLKEQVKMEWPGLGQEVKEICKEIGLPDATSESVGMDKEDVKDAILLHHLQFLKIEMRGKKLEAMARTDMRNRREYTKFNMEDCRMAFRLETYQFDCRANMPTKYGRDLRCRGCNPGLTEQEQEQEQEREREQEIEKDQEQEQEQELENEQDQDREQEQEQEQIENQEHLECCTGYKELWEGLGPYSLLSRCRYFQRVQLKRLQQEKKSRQQTAEQAED